MRLSQETAYLCMMRIFDSYKAGGHPFNKGLLWEYNVNSFDFQRCRAIVVARVLEIGRLSDFFAIFDMYGGIDAVADIAKNEVTGLNEKTLNFMCHAFNLNKEETKCYKAERLRRQHMISLSA